MIGNTNAQAKFVTLGTAQTISGLKKITSESVYMKSTVDDRTVRPSSDNIFPTLSFRDKNELFTGSVEFVHKSTGGYGLQFKTLNTSNITIGMELHGDSTGTYLSVPYRTYYASNTTDVVTIGSLQASTDVVHTSGNETVAGVKTFTGELKISKSGRFETLHATDRTIGTAGSTGAIVYEDSASAVIGSIYYNLLSDNSTNCAIRTRNADGTFKDTIISNAVLTTGDQTIAGVKTFSSGPVITDSKIAINYNGNKYINAQDGSNNNISTIQFNSVGGIKLIPGLATGGIKVVEIQDQRAYSASNTSDIVTIGTLQSSTDVVHTTGDESIAGNKVFTSTIKVKDTGLPTYTSLPSSTRTIFYGFCANDNTTLGLVANFTQASGNRCTYLSAVNTGNTIHRLNLWANVDGSAYVEGPSPTPATNAYRNITISTSEPTSADGSNGDVWIQYEV